MSDENGFEDPILTVDPEAADDLVAPEGVYTNEEHGAVVQSIQPRTFTAKGQPVSYLDIAVMLRPEDGGAIFAHTEPFGEFNCRTEKGQRSKAEEVLKNLGVYGQPASAAEGLPVTVTIGLREYVRNVDKLSEEEAARGAEPKMTKRNFIKNIVLE